MKRLYQNITPEQLIEITHTADEFRGRFVLKSRCRRIEEIVLVTHIQPTLELFLKGYSRIIIRIKFSDLKSMFFDIKQLLTDMNSWFDSLKYTGQSNGFYEFESPRDTKVIMRPISSREHRQAEKWAVVLTREHNE